jgi:hypothetical protein
MMKNKKIKEVIYAICYCGWNNGYIYPDNQNVGDGGFSQGKSYK